MSEQIDLSKVFKTRRLGSAPIYKLLRDPEIHVYLAGPISFAEDLQDYRKSLTEGLRKISPKFKIHDPWEREQCTMQEAKPTSDSGGAEEKKAVAEDIITRDLLDIYRCNMTLAYIFRIGVGTCLSEDTEILTLNGWRNYKTLRRKELVLGLNQRSGFLEYTPILQIAKVTDNLLNFKNRVLDMKVTPNHGILAQTYDFENKKFRGLETYLAKNLKGIKSCVQIPCSGKIDRIGLKISSTKLKLLGWCLTEGSLERKGSWSRITISQSPIHQENCKEILDVLRILQIPFKERKDKISIRGKVHSVLRFRFHGREIPEIVKEWKRIPRKILISGSEDQLRILLKTIMAGDGCSSSNTISEKRFSLVSDYQELLLLLNHRSSISKVGNGFQIYISRRGTGLIKPNQACKVGKKEKAWCVKTLLETLVVRRGGHPFITHNSMELFWTSRILGKPVIVVYTPSGEGTEGIPLWLYGHANLIFQSKKGLYSWLRKAFEEIEENGEAKNE